MPALRLPPALLSLPEGDAGSCWILQDAEPAGVLDFGDVADYFGSERLGFGGHGGDGNAATGGSVNGFGSADSDAIATGNNDAGDGGDGYFFGAIVDTPVAVFNPVNIAVAGFRGTAEVRSAASQRRASSISRKTSGSIP